MKNRQIEWRYLGLQSTKMHFAYCGEEQIGFVFYKDTDKIIAIPRHRDPEIREFDLLDDAVQYIEKFFYAQGIEHRGEKTDAKFPFTAEYKCRYCGRLEMAGSLDKYRVEDWAKQRLCCRCRP